MCNEKNICNHYVLLSEKGELGNGEYKFWSDFTMLIFNVVELSIKLAGHPG